MLFPKFEFNVIFCNFWKVRNRTISKISKISKISECWENPFPNFFQIFFVLFPNFLTPKQSFLTQKLKLYVVFFKIFKIDIQFWLKAKLKFPNFFQTFFAKILWVQNFRFFQKISELQQPNISETRENEKFGKFHLTQDLTFTCCHLIYIGMVHLNQWLIEWWLFFDRRIWETDINCITSVSGIKVKPKKSTTKALSMICCCCCC